MEDNDTRWLLLGLIVVALAAGAWLFRDAWMPPETAAPEPVSPEPAATLPDKRLEPLDPVEPLRQRDEGGELVPLPPLDESDEYFALELLGIFGTQLQSMLVNELLVERTVGTVDNLPRDRVPERIRPLGRLPGSFLVEPDGEDLFLLSPRNFERYDDLVTMFEDASPEEMIATYRRFYPLFNEAYRMLGYPDGHFNDRVIEVIDLLLATPEPEGPVGLVREHVLFAYADPELEALASGQKILVRMGNENARRVKAVLSTLRDALTAASG
jgi:hypothetical protein